VLLFLLLSNSEDIDPGINFSILGIPADKIYHFTAYLPFVPFLFMSTKSNFIIYTFYKKLVFIVIIAVIFSIATETLQLLNPTRSFSFFDMLANFTGILIGSAIFTIYPGKKRLK
jgi:VanZ family protein